MSDAQCPTQQDLCNLYRGDTLPFTFKFNDPYGQAIDISGATLFFTMREDNEDENPALQVKVLFPIDENSENGIGSMKILPSDTESLEPINYYYDFQLVRSPDDVFTVGAGRIRVKNDTTKTTTV